MTKREAWRLLELLVSLPVGQRRIVLAGLPPPAFRTIAEEWFWQAHGGQEEPGGDWRIWLLRAGRGFGKTRAGAEWIWARVRAQPDAQIALVGATLDEVAQVMVKGPSGLLATAGSGESATWHPHLRTLRFSCGAEAYAYSAAGPEKLRGPEHDFAWCDELAKWSRADATWDNLMMGLRRGARPRAVVTTTPRSVPLLRRIRALGGCVETRGASTDNPHLAKAFLAAMEADYGGTRLGRQELDGELIEDVEGTLWPRARIESCRQGRRIEPDGLVRVVIGVDPPVSASGTCGISACGSGRDGTHFVLADESVGAASPHGWAQKVAETAARWGADRVVAEANQGGDMVRAVLKVVAPALPLKLVHASRGKIARAEPVAALFENGEAAFAGRFPALEDELAGMTTGGGYEGPGKSPDRADAMVWAMTELMRPKSEPRIVLL